MTDRAAPIIDARNIALSYDGRRVLDGIDLSIARREVVTLIGPNGSGKTSLARALLGLIEPDHGRIERSPGISIGYVPQRLNIDRNLPLKVRRFLSLAGRTTRTQIDTALTAVAATHIAELDVGTLSGGELQRALLARALLREPDLLVLDEPTQGVDVTGQAEFYELIGQLRDRYDCAVLMISHDLHLVMAATDRVICLNHHICCSGAPESVRQHPEYLALFGAEAAGRLAVYAHHHDHDHDLAGEVVGSHAHDHHA